MRLDRERGELDRLELFEAAFDASAARSGRPAQPRRPPSLRADHFARPLYVLAAALLAVDDGAVDVDELTVDALLGRLLDEHEAAYCQGWDARLGLARLRAGLRPDDGDARVRHAAAALGAGLLAEARWSIESLAKGSTSWERKAHARRLDELAPTDADGLAELRDVLQAP